MKNFFEIDRKSGNVKTKSFNDLETVLKSKTSFLWVDLDAATGKNETKRILEQVFHLNPWTVKQSLADNQRAKLEEHDNYLFMIVPSLIKENGDRQHFTSLSVFLGRNFIVTFHEKAIQCVIDVAAEVPHQDSTLHATPDDILYQLLTEIVDDYRPIIEKLDDEVDLVEQLIFKTADRTIQQKIFGIKKKILSLRRSVQPLREVVSLLTNREYAFISPKVRMMSRTTYDYMLRVYDELETFRELMSSAMDSYISQVSNRLNEIMKILSAVATILLPLTLISGIWGTNFRNLPGLNDPNGFWIMIGAMAVLALLSTMYFRARKWF